MLVKNNPTVARQTGDDFIPLFFSLMNKYQARRVQWMTILKYLVKCRGKTIRENQSIVMAHFKASEAIAGNFMKSPEEWDLRIKYMQVLTFDFCPCLIGEIKNQHERPFGMWWH